MTFELRGEIGGVNSAQLDAVPSIDLNGIFYFISNRSYSSNLSTVYTGTFNAGNVSAIGPVAGVSAPTPGLVDFDAEISADGDTLYFTEGRFDAAGQVQSARIMVAGRGAVGFRRSPQSAAIMEKINTPTLNYAADTSGTGLELFFTRLDPADPRSMPHPVPPSRYRSALRQESMRLRDLPRRHRYRRTANHSITT